ncbi:MAG: amidohydrolase [Ruminococcaceae bacterium]|nr:amidohydrolase [Oscillospiraceae bacterium]
MEAIMQDIIQAVEKHRERILAAERFIWKHPETGYKEVETSRFMEESFIELGYEIVKPENITGFTATLDTGRPGPTVLILGELDSIICPTHPEADPVTGAVHSCGHNAQCAALLGVAAALKEPGILDKYCGKIMLCAVPAEELLEIGYRRKLKEEGIIRYFGGKSEFLSRGLFDGVDMAFMVHTSSSYAVRGGSVGCIAKNIIYKGRAAHAGGSPWDGKNALYAATCGMNACNALRETFREADLIRFHPIITNGGEMVNAIPEDVYMESYVRGRTFKAIAEANSKMNRALTGAALSIGTNIEIIDIPGYAPLENDRNMMEVSREAYALLCPDKEFSLSNAVGTGSTDMGDLSCIMPVVHPYAGGGRGTGHGNDYYIADPVAACVDCAKWQLAMLLILLRDDAARAKQIIADFKPKFESAAAYLAYVDTLATDGNRIEYKDGEAVVRL